MVAHRVQRAHDHFEVHGAPAGRAELPGSLTVAKRQVLQADIDALERFATRARARLRDALGGESETLERLLGEATDDRPVVEAIDLDDPMVGVPSLDAARVQWQDAAAAAARHR